MIESACHFPPTMHGVSHRDWDVDVYTKNYPEMLWFALAATLIPLATNGNTRIPLSLNSFEKNLAQQMKAGAPFDMVSFVDFDGTGRPHFLSRYQTADAQKADCLAGLAFIKAVAQASMATQVYTGRLLVDDEKSIFRLWGDHFPLMYRTHAEEIAKLDNSISVETNKLRRDPIGNLHKLLATLSNPPQIIYYFGDTLTDKKYADMMRTSGIYVKFIGMGPKGRIV